MADKIRRREAIANSKKKRDADKAARKAAKAEEGALETASRIVSNERSLLIPYLLTDKQVKNMARRIVISLADDAVLASLRRNRLTGPAKQLREVTMPMPPCVRSLVSPCARNTLVHP